MVIGTVKVLGVEFEVILVPRGNGLPRKGLRVVETTGEALPTEPTPAPAPRLVRPEAA